MNRTARWRPTHNDGGTTLVELLVVMILLSVVSAITVAAVISAYRTQRTVDDESQGLADVKTVVERLGRDIRDARGVDAGADQSHLEVWIDYNSDYTRDAVNQPDEIVNWQLCGGASTPGTCSATSPTGHFNVLRSTQGGDVRVNARTLVSQIAFCYLADPAGSCLATPLTDSSASTVTLVRATVQYDAEIGNGTKQRVTTFTERLRNVR